MSPDPDPGADPLLVPVVAGKDVPVDEKGTAVVEKATCPGCEVSIWKLCGKMSEAVGGCLVLKSAAETGGRAGMVRLADG